MSSRVEMNGYFFTFKEIDREHRGSLFVEDQNRIPIATLEGLTLKFKPAFASSLSQRTDASMIAVSHKFLEKQLFIESASLVNAIMIANQTLANPAILEQALKALGIEKKFVAPIKPSRKDLQEINEQLRHRGFTQQAVLCAFLFKETIQVVEEALQWSDKIVRSYPESDLDIVFQRDTEGAVHFEIWINRQQIYTCSA
jgi:hypothetical protein